MIKKKAERRDKIRRSKAEAAADIEGSIEQELLERLKAGTYGDIYNYNKKAFNKVMDEKEVVSEHVMRNKFKKDPILNKYKTSLLKYQYFLRKAN